MSWPLQPSVGLLRRLCPLSRSLAFWRPLQVKRCQSSLIPWGDVQAPRSDLLYAGWSMLSNPERSLTHSGTPPCRFGQGVVSASFAFPVLRRLRHALVPQVSLVRLGYRGWALPLDWLAD